MIQKDDHPHRKRKERPVYMRQVYKVELCQTYHPQRLNCTLKLRNSPPAIEGARYRECTAHCRLETVCGDVACSGCIKHAFTYRHIPLYGELHLCRPLPCEKPGYVRFADYACRRERRCTVKRCRPAIYEVSPKKLRPFQLQLLGASLLRQVDPEPIRVSLGERVDLGSVSVGDKYAILISFEVPHLYEDIYILADATFSTDSALRSLAGGVRSILDSRREGAPGAGAGARFGVAYFRDESTRPRLGSRLQDGFIIKQKLTNSQRLTRKAVSRLRAEGGADRPEAGLVALMRLATDSKAGWRTDARKIVVLLGDAPQHEPVCVADEILTRQTVTRALITRGISLLAIDFGNPGLDEKTMQYGCGDEIEGIQRGGQMSTITYGTSGLLVKNVAQKNAAKAVIEGLRKLPVVPEIDLSDCEQEFATRLANKLPRSVVYGKKLTVRMNIKVRASACALSSPKKCIVRFIIGGATIALQEISMERIFGCRRR